MAYQKKFSKKVYYNGILFDSILECKYALYIEDDCEYYYHPLKIWYDKKDKTKFGKQVCNTSYEPDFLVRNLKTNKCYLVEIKDSDHVNDYSTRIKQFHAERYIKLNNKDWEYLLLTEKDFKYPSNKWDKLNAARDTVIATGGKRHMSNMHRMFSKSHTKDRVNKMPFNRHFSNLDERDYLLFIKTGTVRKTKSEWD